MSDRINIGREAYSLDYDDSKGAYTKVRIIFDERAEPVEVGTDDGRVLEISNPWAEPFAEQMAQDILTRIQGYEYQPFDAHGAFLPDNTDLGDAVVVGGVYGAIVSQDITFDGLGNSDVSAPNGEDNENEFGDYVPSADSSTEAQIARLRTSFIVQYGLIQSTIESLDEDLSSQIEQRLNSISLSVSSSDGTTSFVLKDGETTLDSKTVNLHVNAINIDGLISANQIEAISVKAHDLYGQTVTLYDSDETTSVGYFQLTDTQTGTGVQIQSKAGIKIKAGTSYGNYGNIYLEGGETLYLVPAKFTMESGAIRMSANALVLEAQGVGQTQYNYFYHTDTPQTHIGTGVQGQLYFQLVT